MSAIQLMNKFDTRARNPQVAKAKRLEAVTLACRAQSLHYRTTGELVELNLTYTDAELARGLSAEPCF
jgi:hypothetical protein